MIIAVDGPAASGKGTVAKRLAAHYGLAYLDTGRTYRAVALEMLRRCHPFSDSAAALDAAGDVDFNILHDSQLAAPEVSEGASKIAVIPALRSLMVERQRAFARDAVEQGSGAVLDGRDIATVVCPEAEVKLYVTADLAERARRRARELYGEADEVRTGALEAALRLRDERDATRSAGPLRQAEDAILIDTTAMSIDDAFHAAIGIVDQHRARR